MINLKDLHLSLVKQFIKFDRVFLEKIIIILI